MATQTSIIQVIGRVGNLVGRRLPSGKYVVSIYRPHIHNPRTPAQTANRSRMALATQIASRLGAVMQFAKPLSGEKAYAHNRLVGQIKTRLAVCDREGLFPAQIPLVKNPDLEARFTTFTLSRDAAGATLHAELIPEQASRLQTAAVAIIAYNQTRNQWQSLSLLRHALPDTRLTLPEAWADDDIQLAAYILPLLRPQDPAKDTLDAAQVCCLFNMPSNPVTLLPIYHKTATRRPASKTHTKTTSTSDPTATYLQDDSELPPSLQPQNATTSPPD